MRVLRSTELQARSEAYAALGAEAYWSDAHLRRVWVAWNLRRKREAEAERAKRREARQEQWRAVAAGELAPLSAFEVEHRDGRGDPFSDATLADEFRHARTAAPVEGGPLPILEAAPPEECLRVVEAADRLGLRPETLRTRIRRGSVRGYRVRRTGIVVPLEEVARLAQAKAAA